MLGDLANCPMEFLHLSTLPSQTLALRAGDGGGLEDCLELDDRDLNSAPFELSLLIVFLTPCWLLLATAIVGRLPTVLCPDPEVDDRVIGEIVVLSLVDDIP